MTSACDNLQLSVETRQNRHVDEDLTWQKVENHFRLLCYWWLEPHTAYRPVFVIATCRSGSNLLLDCLDQVPGVACLPEILFSGIQCGPFRSKIAPGSALRHIRHSLQTLSTDTRVCKLMLYQLDNCELTVDLLDAAFPDARYIVLYRSSVGEQFVSQLEANATQQWMLREGHRPRKAPVRVDPGELRSYCEGMHPNYQKVLQHAWLAERSVLLSYEELAEDPAQVFGERICPLLDKTPIVPVPRLRKQSSLPLAQRVANYAEVADLMASPLCHQHYSWPGTQLRQRRAAGAPTSEDWRSVRVAGQPHRAASKASDGPATIPIRPKRIGFNWRRLDLASQRARHQWRLQRRWWTLPHTSYQPLFVLATHRSGSNLLLDYLNRLPDVECHSEILCRLFPVGPAWFQIGPWATAWHIRLSLHTLRTATRGCKLMLDQLAASRLPLDHLHAAFPTARYIVLYRESLAEQFVSRVAAKVTDQWKVHLEHERKLARVRVEPQALLRYCERERKGYLDVLQHAWLPERAVLLSYEELVADPVGRLEDEICPLLGVPPTEPRTLLLKQSDRPLAERVENYREVGALLNSPLCQQHYVWPGQQQARRRAA